MRKNIPEIIRSLQNPETSYRFQNTPPRAPLLSQMNPLNTCCPTSWKFIFTSNINFLKIKIQSNKKSKLFIL
jgi:hypothetical protein